MPIEPMRILPFLLNKTSNNTHSAPLTRQRVCYVGVHDEPIGDLGSGIDFSLIPEPEMVPKQPLSGMIPGGVLIQRTIGYLTLQFLALL